MFVYVCVCVCICLCESCELIKEKSCLPAPLVAKENTLTGLLNPKAFLVDIRNSYLRKINISGEKN